MVAQTNKGGDMYDTMQAIIHKAAVNDLQTQIRHTGLCIGDAAELHLDDLGRVTVWGRLNRRRFLIRRRVLAHIGNLGPQACEILTPVLHRNEHLRVRIVGLTPEHLAPDGKAEMHISVWGNPRHAKVPVPDQPPA
jgi:hypothetical protein